MNNKNIILISAPFVVFAITYFALYEYYLSRQKTIVPLIVGLRYKEAIPILYESNFSIKIIDYTYDHLQPSGTIIWQYPLPHTSSSQRFPIKIKVSLKPHNSVPSVIGKHIDEAKNILDKEGCCYTVIPLASWYPFDIVCAEGYQKQQKHVTLYVSKGESREEYYNNYSALPCSILKNNEVEITCIDSSNNIINEEHNYSIKAQSINPGEIYKPNKSIILWH
jgi:hypothetical protein